MAWFGIAASIGGSLLSGISGRKGAKQSAKDAKENAKLELEKLRRDTLTQLHEQAYERGAFRVSAGGSGLDTSSFSDLFDSNEILNQLDLENMKFNSNLIQRGFRRDASNARQQGKTATNAMFADIGTSLLGGFSGGGGKSAASSQSYSQSSKGVKGANFNGTGFKF